MYFSLGVSFNNWYCGFPGANYESNIIFSPSSYVPKSAMLNLTVDLFGESINMFEVSGPFLT